MQIPKPSDIDRRKWEPCKRWISMRNQNCSAIFRGTNIEPISAIEVFTHMKPAQAIRYIQIKPAVPPLISAMIEVLPLCQLFTQLPGKCSATTDPNAVSHVAIRIMENPKMETNRKFRYAQTISNTVLCRMTICEMTILAVPEPFPCDTYPSDPRENPSFLARHVDRRGSHRR